VIGAAFGIGKGLSERFVKAGIKVTAVGSPRRRDRLDEFVSIDGTSKAGGVAFNFTNTTKISSLWPSKPPKLSIQLPFWV
jgi:NAD(P)-dependent dehydrogenase (short-subunit alcohol dehydrogenase family)